MTKNRAKRARERAGLTLGQAARLLELSTENLVEIEERDPAFVDAGHEHMADVYGVNIDWLCGDKELCDYASLRDVPGYDDLTPHDRDVIAEFAAALPTRIRRECAACGMPFVVSESDATTMCRFHRRV